MDNKNSADWFDLQQKFNQQNEEVHDIFRQLIDILYEGLEKVEKRVDALEKQS